MSEGKRVEASHIWEKHEDEPAHRRALDLGTAGEFIVCADLILAGFRAFQSSQGLPYDVVADFGGNLIRIAVKSTTAPRSRPARENSRVCYQFMVSRGRRLSSGKTDGRAYDPADVDLVAFCGLDTRRVAYCSILECARSMHIDASDGREGEIAYTTGRQRKTFDQFTLERALDVHFGRLPPRKIIGRERIS